MNYTLLDIVQSTLSSLDSDEVNSIDDNTESLQVSYIVRDCYMDIVARLNLEEHYTFFELNATSSSSPTIVTPPSNIVTLKWIKYDNIQDGDTAPVLQPVDFLPLEEFLHRMHMMTDEDDTTLSRYTYTWNSETFNLTVFNDRGPSFWTTPDDRTIIFDAYDLEIENNLMKAKTMCYGQKDLGFTLDDSWTPDLDPKQMQLLLNEVKSQAFVEVKQMTNVNAEKKARRGWVSAQRDKRAIRPEGFTEHSRLRNYGRK